MRKLFSIALVCLTSSLAHAFSFVPYIPSTSTYQGAASVINIASGTITTFNTSSLNGLQSLTIVSSGVPTSALNISSTTSNPGWAINVSTNGVASFSGTATLALSTNTILPGTTFYQNGAANIGGAITATGNVSFTNTNLYGILGSTWVDSAFAGNVGESTFTYINESNKQPLASATWQSISTVTLSAGDWNISANAGFFEAGAGFNNSNYVAISSYSATTTTDQVSGLNQFACIAFNTNEAEASCQVTDYRVSLSGSQAFYLKVNMGFNSGQGYGYGRISARRMR